MEEWRRGNGTEVMKKGSGHSKAEEWTRST
jgi:hypothetical protein